ncbi:hypothetical protein BDN72DRAFT_875452 [Pluteus cervinus]|uniref:Uncharacterized protein n=1 Tax=Pluteus cervinus TaxID=181527 RepID=A0ACD3B8Q7_9AGAR|nr:hypothetical protein BDN72DRAFT_875452 [Pluteus cervinus]
MHSALFFALASSSLVYAVSFSSGCTSTLTSVVADPNSACLDPGDLVPLFLGSNSSIVQPLDTWIKTLCTLPACSNDTLASIVKTVASGCSAELTALGFQSSDTDEVVTAVQQYYPAVRQIACLKDGNTVCLTETLTAIQDVNGPLTFQEVVPIIEGDVSANLPTNITCSNCQKAAYNIIKAQLPIADDQVTDAAVQKECGASFTDGQTPAGIVESANASADAPKKNANDAHALFTPFTGFIHLSRSNLASLVEVRIWPVPHSHHRPSLMTSTPGNARSSTYDIPKPATGLAEWTSRISAIQQQVDADDEAEQRRLEEEIAAARMQRARRSHGTGYASQFSDLNGSNSSSKALSSHGDTAAARTPDPPSSQRIRTNEDSTRMSSSTHFASGAGTRRSPLPTPSSEAVGKKEPISLAAFMGGRATGPRLNRHVPQQDASDPSQFDQYVRSNVPHPVFGSGGIAMPGLAAQRTPVVNNGHVSNPLQAQEKPSANGNGFRERKSSTPSVARRYMERLEKANKPSGGSESREQRLASPVMPTFERPPPERPVPTFHQASAQKFGVAQPSRPSAPSDPVKTGAANTPAAPQEPRRQTPNPPKTSPTPPSLARPIRPEPKPSSVGPVIPPSTSPSPAFLKPQPQKDLTPSISRLQGRGFVQSMVQVSSQLESTQAEPARVITPRRSSTVLDRWQPESSPSKSPTPVTAHPTPYRSKSSVDLGTPKANPPAALDHAPLVKSARALPKPPNPGPATLPVRPAASPGGGVPSKLLTEPVIIRPQPLMKRVKEPATVEPRPAAPVKLPGLGSASTVVVYRSEPEVQTQYPDVDELGVQRNHQVSWNAAPPSSKVSRSPGKPLTHPTKDRARKPRKTRSATQATQGESDTLVPPTHTTPPFGKSESAIPLDGGLDVSAVVEERNGTFSSLHSSLGSSTLEPSSLSRSPQSTSPVPTTVSPTPREPPIQSRQEPMKASPQSPLRQTRIPSTGNRATVMDVAQALELGVPEVKSEPPAESTTPVEQSVAISRPILSAVQAEKRKSSYEKYSSFMMPPLKEEVTPNPSPANTLRNHQLKLDFEMDFDIEPADVASDTRSKSPIPFDRPQRDMLHFPFIDSPLPQVNIPKLANYIPHVNTAPSDILTISVDVLNISGGSTTPVAGEKYIFYEAENLAIVHRAKSKSAGLVTTMVWCWQGKRGSFSSQEEEKLQELSRRYNTNATIVQQNIEPAELVQLLGGRIIIRQGSRAHWSAENTAMHVIRSSKGVVFIDEIDLSIHNLCSAFSYCISMLNTFYVWHGCGAVHAERRAAAQYAHFLKGRDDSGVVVELSEGENDDDDMFWMILGDDDIGRAEHWRWRRSASVGDPRIWRVDAARGPDSVFPVVSVWTESSPYSGVHIFDCIWEYFVLIHEEARESRDDIRLALSVATELSKTVAPARPFVPPVHVIVLPSQLPLDLRLCFRDLDETLLNGTSVPDHMNLLSSTEAWRHLQTSSWTRNEVNDHEMLPLGVSPAQVLQVSG